MKSKRNIKDLDVLLGRGSIGAARRDAILKAVLERTRYESPAPSRWRWSLMGLGSVSVVATVLLLLIPRLSPPTVTAPFRAKGSVVESSTITPSAEIECIGGTLDACPIGSLLVVRVAGVHGFVSAWSEPVGGGERIWYFSADTHSPQVEATFVPTAATTRAIKIGREHVTGVYIVEILVTERPMKRNELIHVPASAVLAKERRSLTLTSL